jgi:hypothetical protein
VNNASSCMGPYNIDVELISVIQQKLAYKIVRLKKREGYPLRANSGASG